MAVRIRLKRMGRRHRPFFRVCAMDSRVPRDGKVIEELGYYDPMVKETDARAVLKGDRIDYWLGKGALPSDKVGVLIKKYGSNGTHLEQQQQAFARLTIKPTAPPPTTIELPKREEPAPEPAAAESGEPSETAEPPVAEAAATEEATEQAAAPAEESGEATAEASSEEKSE